MDRGITFFQLCNSDLRHVFFSNADLLGFFGGSSPVVQSCSLKGPLGGGPASLFPSYR